MLCAGIIVPSAVMDVSSSKNLLKYLPTIIIGVMCGVIIATVIVIFIVWRRKGWLFCMYKCKYKFTLAVLSLQLVL